MANSSHIPSGNMHEVRPASGRDNSNGRLRSPSSEESLDRPETSAPPESAAPGAANGNQIGPRKLVRPKLPARALWERSFGLRGEPALLTHQSAMAMHNAGQDSSNAEAFYFQKQVQTQTLMVFVLEDGEHVEGYIEWYDRNAIKVRNGSRTLIYKSAIKYLYKAGDVHGSLDGFNRSR